ncbi:hypothetical protein BH18ACI5_BH18ACI5_11440 [soil metagenome]
MLAPEVKSHRASTIDEVVAIMTLLDREPSSRATTARE